MPAPSAVIDSDDVFDARMHSGATTFSTRSKSSRLAPRSSTIASMTSCATQTSGSVTTVAIRATAASAAAALEPALRDELVERFGDALLRGVARAEARVVQLDAMAVQRGDLRDARAHRAGADDGDGGVLAAARRVMRAVALAAGEARRPLGDERGDAFAIVVAVAQRALQVALEIELRRQRVAGRRPGAPP